MNAKPLISLEKFELLKHNPKVVILDATIDKVNQKIDQNNIELIPGSLFFDIEHAFSDPSSKLPHTLVNEDTFNTKTLELGINEDSTIIIYDRWGIYSSPRAWWMFKYFGHKNVYVLDGGITAWKAKNETTSTYARAKEIGNFTAKISHEWLVDKNYILSNLNNEEIKIIDARGKGRFEGKVPEPRAGLRSGHIPNSTNIPFEEVLNGSFLKSEEELKRIFEGHSTKNGLNIFSCGSGITASILALAAKEIGISKIAVYDGSWAEWGADIQLPIEI